MIFGINKSDEFPTVINTAHSHVTGLCDEVGGGHYHQPPVMVVVPGSCQLSRTECPLSQDTSGPGLTLWLPSVSCPAQPPVTSVWRHMTTGLSIWCRDSVRALYVSFLGHKSAEKKEKCLLWGFGWLEQCIYGIRDQHSSLSPCLDLRIISTWRLGSLSHDDHIGLIVMMAKSWGLIYLSEKTHQERMDNLRQTFTDASSLLSKAVKVDGMNIGS